jgi:CarD family transcriptional regulator
MPSNRKAAKSSKASTERRAKSAKTARKPANSSKEEQSKNVRGKAKGAPATRKVSARSASSAVKEATKAAAKKALKHPTKSAAKAAGKTSAKKTEAKKAIATQKTSSGKGALAKNATKPVTAKTAARGGAKIATGRQAAPASKSSAKKGVILAQKSKATASVKNSAADKKQEKSTHTVKPQDITALNPVVNSPPARIAGAQPTASELTTPVASEAIQVAKNLSEIAAKAAARKPASPIIDGAPNDEKIAQARSAAPPARQLAAMGAKPRAPSQKLGFKLSEFIVYPAHGVGQIIGIEVQEVAGFSLELFVVSFIKDKMILKVPTAKVTAVGMRKLAELEVVDKALGTLSGRARVKRTMWSRRAQEYEAKINSGDLVTIAEVVRDLYRSDTQPEQSYSERQLYEAALDRMAREVAAVRKLIDSEALKVIETFLLKGPRRGAKSEADLADDSSDDADVDRAA